MFMRHKSEEKTHYIVKVKTLFNNYIYTHKKDITKVMINNNNKKTK